MKLSPFGFYEGAALLAVAETYPTLLDVVSEAVQNALDTEATRVWIIVNKKKRDLFVRDNGNGTGQAKFEKALTEVCMTQKSRTKLGRFGRGLVAAAGKCVQFTFTSTPASDPHNYLQWIFNTETLQSQKKIAGIPMLERPDLNFGAGQSKTMKIVPWRSELAIEGYTKDRIISKLSFDVIRDVILAKYSVTMRRNRTVVSIIIVSEDGSRSEQEIRAKDFDGTPLPLREIEAKNGDTTKFKLFLAKRRKGMRAKVVVGEMTNDYRMEFEKSLGKTGMKISEEAVAALLSGVFEGEILSARARLHADRQSFKVDEKLEGLCAAIDEWYEKFGSVDYKEAQEERESERYQESAVRSLRVLEALVKSPLGEAIMNVINTFRQGLAPEASKVQGRQTDSKALSVRQPGTGEGESASHREPESQKPGYHSMVALGPRGRRRTITRSGSLGIQIAHEPMQSDRLYVLDISTGLLTFNVSHPLWTQCEDHSVKTMERFQEYLMLQALTIESLPDETWKEVANLYMDELDCLFVFELIQGEILSGRIPSRKKEEAGGKSLVFKPPRK